MKRATSILLLFLLCKQIIAQHNTIICGTYKCSAKIIIHVYEPIDGHFNLPFMDKEKENSFVIAGTDSFFYKTKINEPASFLVYITDYEKVYITKALIVLFPGDSVNLKMNLLNENKESITYSGSNYSGQKLFNDINYNPVYKYQGVIERLNSLEKNKHQFIQDIDFVVKKILKGFDSLQYKSLITAQFNAYMKTTFTQLIYHFVIDKFIKDYSQREAYTKYERDSIIDHFFNKQPITDPYLKSSYNSYFYENAYYNYQSYKNLKLFSIEPLFEKKIYTNNGKRFIVENDCAQFLYISDEKIREDLWAIFMLMLLRLTDPGTLSETINQFMEIFPNSKWNKLLKKQEENTATVTSIDYHLQSPVCFIDSTKNMFTLESVLEEMPNNKPIFLDLWASWCEPCIRTFQFNKLLDTFLLANNIERLYISLDGGAENKWIYAINRYALGGYHILANDSLVSSIKNVCKIMANEPIAIPRYILINRKKEIVLNNAMTPENLDILKEQINELLVK